MFKKVWQKFKDKDQEIIKPLLAILGSIAVCIAAVIFLQILTQAMKTDYIAAQAGSLRVAVNSVGAEITEAQSSDEVLEILRQQDDTGAVMWVAFDSTGLLFDRNDLYTEQTTQKDYTALADYYTRNGGKNVTKLIDLLKAGGRFSVVAQRTSAQGSELLTIGSFSANGEIYRIGTCVPLNWLYAQGNILNRILYLRILTGVLCALIVALVLFCALQQRRKNLALAALRRENAAKNRLVTEQWEKLTADGGTAENNTLDGFTGLYSRDFLTALLAQTTARNPAGFGVVMIELDGQNAGVYQQAARVILSSAEEKNICAVAGQNKIAVLVYNTTQDALQARAKQLSGLLDELFTPEEFQIGFCYKQPEMTAQDAYTEALQQVST